MNWRKKLQKTAEEKKNLKFAQSIKKERRKNCDRYVRFYTSSTDYFVYLVGLYLFANIFTERDVFASFFFSFNSV